MFNAFELYMFRSPTRFVRFLLENISFCLLLEQVFELVTFLVYYVQNNVTAVFVFQFIPCLI